MQHDNKKPASALFLWLHNPKGWMVGKPEVNRGTDHGHANCMFVMGGDVRGGQVYGKWPGLADHQLNEGRDLALTTDFRSVVGEILAKHIGVADLKPVFPGFDNNPRKFPGLIKA